MAYLGAAYLWVKAAHLIFVIFLMAGLFMIPRFFVYHQECAVGSDEDRKWIDREQRLLKIILNPSLVLVWVLGLMLMVEIGAWSFGWFHLKLLFVIALSGYHGWIASYAKKLARGQRTMTDRQLRLLNEVPGVAAAVIVIAVIVKPF
ncbi:putative membrane protein [Sphingobium sp. ba1]|jgi:putative membrane protein|uniref:CopD family protein n=1 Tax=Sphingobium sp. ba1 TaxID=1522072 RepID=UPI000503B758|nr:CopD family protein [Sphingobium sp. ba1]KFL44837.1 putative membrane protein [Sphingobium sp. ba1]|tara:strand:- start:15012 stop:15452 length:441 start_codon:yes stop_codon:yes gene_type:complete